MPPKAVDALPARRRSRRRACFFFSCFFFFFRALLSPAPAPAAAAPVRIPLPDTAKEDCVVAVPLTPRLYAAAAPFAPLRKTLLITDAAGRPRPFLIQRSQTRSRTFSRRWIPLRILSLRPDRGRLDVECELPPGETNAAERARFRILTPLRDFEQTVTVTDAAGAALARSAPIYDYSRYADVRATEIPTAPTRARRFRLSFSRPESRAVAPSFEKQVEDGPSGARTKEVKRYRVTDRPFRLEGIELAEPEPRTEFLPAPDVPAAFPVSLDSNPADPAGRALLSAATFFAPVTRAAFRIRGSNFSRPARAVEIRPDGTDAEIAAGRISAARLPGMQSRDTSLEFRRPASEARALRFEIPAEGNPPLEFEDPPATLSMRPFEAAFIAEAGQRYFLVLGAPETPRASNPQIRAYIESVRDPVRWRLPPEWDAPVDPAAAAAAAGPSPLEFLTRRGLPIASALVFLILLALCLRLLKSAAPR